MTDERLEALMVKVTDGVATPGEREELMAHLGEHPELGRELEAHMALKAVTDGWVKRLELDVVQDRQEPLQRIEMAIGVTLVLLGAAVLSGFGLVELFADADAPLWVKLGTGGMVAGFAVLLFSAIRWRMTTAKADKYTEVIR